MLTLDHHGLSMTQFRAALTGAIPVNGVQQALLANIVRASGGDVGRASERDRERQGPERKQERRHEPQG
jgi:hypothetical protein